MRLAAASVCGNRGVSYVVGKVSKLTVTTTNAGAGTLAVHVEGPSKVAIICTELDDGYDFTYTPMAAGNYMIVIKYCSVTIAGCPFKAVVTGRHHQGGGVYHKGGRLSL